MLSETVNNSIKEETNMKKKIGLLSLLLVLAMCLAFLPGLQTEAEAAAASSITVNGYNLPSGYYLPTATWTKTTTKPSGSYFYYSGGTLTIYNVTLTSVSGTRAVYAEGDLVVSLSGTNKLTTNNANGIRSTGTLKFTGSGSLTVSSSGYDAIYSSGNMEFAQTGTVTATATGGTSSGVECAAKLTIGGNLNATSESSYAIYASGDISMTKGTVNATGNCTYSAGGICSNGAITVSGGTLNVTSKSDGIISKYDFWQKAGNVTVNADWNGIVVETATNNVIIHEGTMTVTAVRNGLKAQKFYINGGHGYIKSTNTSSDSSYYAVKLAGNTSSYYVQKGNVNSYGSTTTSSSALTKLVYANLPTYDYVYFTGYVTVNGVELRDGYYLQSGKTTTDTTKPSGSYAYYSGNTLTLNNFEGSNNSASGIDSRYDLNIVLAQGSTNKLTVGNNFGIDVALDLIISGTGKLTITGDDTCIYAGTGCTTGATTLKLTSNSRNGIQVLHGNFTMNGGDLDIYAKNDGINAERVTINGGTALIKSSNMTSDSNYSSIRTGNFVVGSGLRVIGSTDPTGAVASDIDVSKLRTYDYIKVDKASTIVSGPLNGTVTGMQETANVNLALYKSGQAEPAYKAVRLGNGSFTFTFVEYGTYTLKATATGYQDFTTTVTVSGSTPSVTITMTKKSSGNITVECVGDISYTVSGSVVKVTHDVACKVGYLSGSEYVAITPTKNSDGSYSFTAPAGVTNVLLVVKGDVNGDGKVTSSDYSRLNAVLLKKTTMAW